MNNYAIIILAAGQSKRLGQPKQLVAYKDKTLLNRAIDTAIETQIENIIIVLGAHFEEIKKSVTSKNILILKNENYAQGMASSIHLGLMHIMSYAPNIENVLFMVCDQPFVDAQLLSHLVEVQNNSGMSIVASQYGDVLGTPALFHKSFFEELLQLKGDAGAGKLIKKHLTEVAIVQFDKGIIDIDSEEDLKFLA